MKEGISAGEDAISSAVERRYKMAIEASHMGVWDWNLDSGEIYVDPKLKAILGYEDHEIRNEINEWASHVYHGDQAAVMEVAQAHLDGATPYYDIEHRMVHKDGSLRWFLARGQALRDAEGRARRMVGTDTDITAAKTAQEALRISEEALRTSAEQLERANAALQRELRDRERAEAQLRKMEDERSLLMRRIMTTQEDERRLIARELHDRTGQSLTSLLVRLKTLEDSKELRDDEEVRTHIGELRGLAAETLSDVRALSFNVRPNVLEDSGLEDALRSETRKLEERLGIETVVQTHGRERALPKQTEAALYRIARAALTNVTQHAQAQRIGVLISYRPDDISIIIEDDGLGFDVDGTLTGPVERRFGLLAMQERARAIGGTVTFESSPGDGATVFVTAPTHPSDETERSVSD